MKLNNNLDELKNIKNELKNNLNKFRKDFKSDKEVLENTVASAVDKVNIVIIYKNGGEDEGTGT